MYAIPIRQLIEAFSRLPSVGPRTAERYVFFLLKKGKKEVGELALAMKNLIEEIKSCDICWDFSDQNPCSICANPKRNVQTLCIVAEPQDIQAIEKTREYQGRYHVLRGLLRAEEEFDLSDTKIPELLDRVLKEELHEIILALNPDLSGETTMLYIEKQIQKIRPTLLVSRLARGLPMGSDLKYADDITLGSALRHRVQKD